MKNNIIAERLKEKRKELGFSSAEAARKIGVTQANYYRWENGKTMPTVESLVKIAQIYKVPVGWIVGENKEELPLIEPVNTKGADQKKASTRYLHKTSKGYVCTAKHCEWRIHGVCPGTGCMKERTEQK